MNTTRKFFFILISIFVILLNNAVFKQSDLKLSPDETLAPVLSNITRLPDERNKSTDTPNLCKFPEEGIPVLMYHSISTNPQNSLCVSQAQFTQEMEWLHSRNYHSLNLDEFYQALVCGASLPDNPILITFDDGYADNYEVAWPILQRYGFHATFFIVTDYVGPYRIDWEQLKELVGQGNSVGSHSAHHYDLKTLTYRQQKRELGESKQILEDHLGISIKAFCFPSGKYNKTTLTLLTELGYTLGFSTKPGKVHLGDNPFELKRVRVEGGMSSDRFIKQVS